MPRIHGTSPPDSSVLVEVLDSEGGSRSQKVHTVSASRTWSITVPAEDGLEAEEKLRITHRTPDNVETVREGVLTRFAKSIRFADFSAEGAAPHFRLKAHNYATADHVDRVTSDAVGRRVEEDGAVGDGVVDDRAALQATCDAVAASGGGTVAGRRGATYLIDSRHPTLDVGLNIPSNVAFLPWGCTIQAGDNLPGNTPLIYADDDTTDVEIGGFELDGNKQRMDEPNWGAAEDEGVDANGTRLYIHDLYIHDCAADAIDLDGATDFVIDRIRSEDNGGNSVHAVGGSTNGIISKVQSKNNAHSRLANAGELPAADAAGIDVRGSDILVTECTSLNDARGFQQHDGNRNTWLGCSVTFAGTDADPNTAMLVKGGTVSLSVAIVGCVFRQRAGAGATPGIVVSGYRGTLIEGCKFESCSTGVTIDGDAGDVTVSSCQFRIGSLGVRVTGHAAGRGWQVTGCRTFQVAGASVRVEGSTDGTISGNVFRRDAGLQAIALMGNLGTVEGVRVQGNDLRGLEIRLFGSPENCRIMDNEFAGFENLTGTGHIIRNNIIDGAFVAEGDGAD